MTDLPYPDERFDVWNSQLLGKLPQLRARLEVNSQEIRQQIKQAVDNHGPLQIKLRHRKDNRFNDVMFDWVYVARNDQEEAEVSEAEEMVWWNPDYSRAYNSPMDKEELVAAIGPYEEIHEAGIGYSGHPYTRETYEWVNEQLRDYIRYQFNHAVLERSEPIADLRSMGAEWSYYRNNDDPLLVVPDKKVATFLKLKY